MRNVFTFAVLFLFLSSLNSFGANNAKSFSTFLVRLHPATLEQAVDVVTELRAQGVPDRRIAQFVSELVDHRIDNANSVEGFWRRFSWKAAVVRSEGDLTDEKFANERDNLGGRKTVGRDYEDRARWAWDLRYGNCAETTACAYFILKGAGFSNVRFMGNPIHNYVVIGMDPGADVKDPRTWGKDAYVVDGYQGSAYDFAEAFRNRLIGNSGGNTQWDETQKHDDPNLYAKFIRNRDRQGAEEEQKRKNEEGYNPLHDPNIKDKDKPVDVAGVNKTSDDYRDQLDKQGGKKPGSRGSQEGVPQPDAYTGGGKPATDGTTGVFTTPPGPGPTPDSGGTNPSGSGTTKDSGGITSPGPGTTPQWVVLCNRQTGRMVVSRQSASTTQRSLGGPFSSQSDASGWVNSNCPSGRCDRNGQCVASKDKPAPPTPATTKKQPPSPSPPTPPSPTPKPSSPSTVTFPDSSGKFQIKLTFPNGTGKSFIKEKGPCKNIPEVVVIMCPGYGQASVNNEPAQLSVSGSGMSKWTVYSTHNVCDWDVRSLLSQLTQMSSDYHNFVIVYDKNREPLSETYFTIRGTK